MDVRQRGTVSGGGGGTNNSTQRSIETISGSIGKISRTNSKTNHKDTNGSAMRTLGTSCCFGMIVAFLIISLGMITGKISLTDTSTTSQTKDKQLVRGALEKPRIITGEDPVQLMELEGLRQQNRDLLDKYRKLQLKTEQQLTEMTKNEKETDTTKLTARISRLVKSIDRLHEMIQLISKRHLIEKYGVGPHYVEMLLSFDPQSNIADTNKNKNDDTAILLIEMAPIDEMPATVLWFLEQVNEKIYDGCSFHRNAHHVVQGGPIANFETTDGGKSVMQKIRNTGLDSIPFQEYSPNFPHVKYTLGYAGRPGGPDFYVSTQDNTKNHGPGGQASYEEASEADPCFAKVVSGYEPVVDRMHQSEVQPGNYMRMKHYVAIRHMRLVPPDEVGRLLKS